MLKRPVRLLVYAGIALIVLLIAGRTAVDLYTETLWFGALGYADVLWKRIFAGAGLRLLTGALGAVIVLVNLVRVVRHLGPVQLRRRYGNIEIAEVIPRGYVRAGILVAAALAGWWLSGISFPSGSAVAALAWWHHVPWNTVDPLFGRDLSFHVFALPFYARLLDFLLLVVVWSAMLALVGYVLVGAVRVRNSRLEVEERPRRHFALLVGALVLLFGIRYWIGRYGLLLDGSGFGGGVGYTDVHARLPAYHALAVLSILSAGTLVWGAIRRTWLPAVIALGLLILTGLGFGVAYPAIVQRIRVVPNQLARESEYIRWNIEFTRRGFGIESIARRAQPISGRATPSWSQAAPTFERLPLWDTDALQASFRTIESAYPYLDFPSVHIDRYGPPGEAVPVGIGVREFTATGMSPDARTWNTLHFDAQQVRGNGAVVVPTSSKTAEGDPVFWLRGVLPVDRSALAPPSIDLHYPSVFFGQTTQGYLIVSPATLPDTAAGIPLGVPIGNLGRRLAFSWLLGDRNLLFTGELREESRLLYRRQIPARLSTIAPFLYWSTETYPVIHEGRIVWIADGYSVSATYPVSRPFPMPGLGSVRYVRNSVKATTDAVTGAVTLYTIDDDEPMVATYARAFPTLFRSLSEMPAGLRDHLRYPLPLLRTQSDVLEEYHVEEPAAFFAGQNEWQVPAEGGSQGSADVPSPPIYTVVPDGQGGTAFVATNAFIARQRQNMTAILLVTNTVEDYGRMTLLEMPRDEQVAGPRQVRAIVEQDPTVSPQLSLWRQGGSAVDIGQLRMVPLDSSIAYVMPVYLRSSANAVTQLQRVVASDGRSIRMALTLREALAALGGAEPEPEPEDTATAPVDPGAWAPRALEAATAAERALRDGQWAEFGRRWAELLDLLRRASGSQQ